jgi:hypothetical protein
MKEALSAVGLVPDEEVDAAVTPGLPAPPPLAPDAGIAVADIEPGIAILRFDPLLLAADPRVKRTYYGVGSGFMPFLCLEVDGAESTWTALTRTGNRRRLPLDPEWRIGGNYPWRNGQLFLTTGACLWRGPNAAFSSAGWRDALNNCAEPPRLTRRGLDAVCWRVAEDEPRW